MLNTVANPTLPPSNLCSLLPIPQTPWMISPALFQRLQADKTKTFRQCEILSSDPEWQFIFQYFSAHPPPNKSIAKAYCIHNGAQHTQFEANISITEQQAQNPHFNPKWKNQDPDPLRYQTLKRWEQLTAPYTPCTLSNIRKDPIHHTKIIPLWHGTQKAICQSICSTGFTTFGKHALIKGQGDTQNTDLGYFGSGIYFTTSANYAATIYSDGNLLLAWVSMREPYPVIADQTYPKKPKDMDLLEGLGAYQNYNAHYIPVISINPQNPHCAIYYPCTKTQTPSLDEIVVFTPSQTLTRFWIQLQPELLKTPTAITLNHLLVQILQLLDNEAVQQNKELSTLLEQKSEFLLTFNLSDPLTSQNLTFYNSTLKLLDQTGKVRNVVLRQLLPSSPPPQSSITTPAIAQKALSNHPTQPSLPSTTSPITTPTSQKVPKHRVTSIPSPIVSKEVGVPACAFGKTKWTTYFGDIGLEPPLPPNIHQILQTPCPIWPGKTIEETHILVVIPATVDEVPLTLKTFGEVIQKPKKGPKTKYTNLDLGEYQDIHVQQSYWAFMTQNVLEESRTKPYDVQFDQIQTLVQKTGIPYSVPKVREATIAILVHHVSTGKKLYNDNPLTYTRCEEFCSRKLKKKAIVGAFSSVGLSVNNYHDYNSYEKFGMGMVWSFR